MDEAAQNLCCRHIHFIGGIHELFFQICIDPKSHGCFFDMIPIPHKNKKA